MTTTKYIRLRYVGRILKDDNESPRLWDVLSPIPGYVAGRYNPTFGIEGLMALGIVGGPYQEKQLGGLK